MITLLGATGYVGKAFSSELEKRNLPFFPLSRREVDFSNYNRLVSVLKESRASFVINAAGYTGRPSTIEYEETYKGATLTGNLVLALTVAHACASLNIPYGHVSSGCIYVGGKMRYKDKVYTVSSFSNPEVQKAIADGAAIIGYDEKDTPNFDFWSPPCSFYSGVKALAEQSMVSIGKNYLWRLRLPFNEEDGPRNFITKLLWYHKVYDNLNSISHLGDYVSACVDCIEQEVPYGIYNVANSGYIRTREIIELMEKLLPEVVKGRKFEYWINEDDFRSQVKAPRAHCILSVGKLESMGIKVRSVREALTESLTNWKKVK